MMKNVLVTGGSGYFGESLVRILLDKKFNVSILDINEPDKDILENVKFFKCDIRSKDKVIEICKNIDVILHNVAQVPLAKNNDLFHSVNYTGTENILEAALINNCKHFVYTSSSAVFGVPLSNPVTNQSVPKPAETYGLAKYEGEKLALGYQDKGLNVTVIRPRTILGHGRLGIFQILFEWIHQGKNIPVFDGGDNLYQFIHADDLANAIVLATEKEIPGIFNIGTDRFMSMKETLNSLIIHSKTKSKVKSLNSSFIIPFMKLFSYIGLSPLGAYHSLMYGKSMYFDLSKAKNELGWKPKYSNVEMFIESYEWYIKNKKNILTNNNKSHHQSAVKHGILSIFNKIFL